jgi:molybdopterin-binding protein
MRLSTRYQLVGTIVEVNLGTVTATEVAIGVE